MHDSPQVTNARLFVLNERGNDCQWVKTISSRGNVSLPSAGEGMLRRRPFWILSLAFLSLASSAQARTLRPNKQTLDMTAAWQLSHLPGYFTETNSGDAHSRRHHDVAEGEGAPPRRVRRICGVIDYRMVTEGMKHRAAYPSA